MIRATLFKEKQIFPVFFQIPSAVYVWTQEWCSFQMERSHFDKMTSIITSDSKAKNANGEWQEIRRDKRVMTQGAHDLQCLRMSRSLISNTQGRLHVNHYVYHRNVSTEQVSDREGSHLQCRFSLEQTWWSLCSNSPTGLHKERCGQKLWMMVSNITRNRDRRASCYLKSISRLWRCHVLERILDWD